MAEEEKKVVPTEKKEAIAKGEIKKRSEFQKFLDNFVTEDLPRVKRFLKEEVIEPYVKKALWDAISGAAEMFIFHDDAHRRTDTRSSGYGGAYTTYSSRYGNADRGAPTRSSEMSRFDYDTIVFGQRQKAAEVLDQLLSDVEEYGMVTMAAYYEYASLQNNIRSTMYNYGWTDLRTAEVVRAIGSDGWTLRLPKAVSLR